MRWWKSSSAFKCQLWHWSTYGVKSHIRHSWSGPEGDSGGRRLRTIRPGTLRARRLRRPQVANDSSGHASRKPPEPPRCIHHYSSEIVPDAYPAVLAVERRRDWTQRPGPGTDTDREEGSHAQRRGKFELAPNP